MKKIINKKQDGYALFLVIVLLSAMMITTLIFARTFLNEIRTTAETRRSMQAIYAANTGIERALYNLHKNKEEDFSEENTLYVSSSDTYQVSTRRDGDDLIIHSDGVSKNVLRELEIRTPVSLSSIKKEMEDTVFNALTDTSCEITTTCAHPKVITELSSTNNICHTRSYYTDETFSPEKLYFFQQENTQYADCQLGESTNSGVIALNPNIALNTPYYFAYRAFYTQENQNENLEISTIQGQNPLESDETLFTQQENGFFSCIFSTSISFLSGADYLILQNAQSSGGLIIDWYAFYKEIPQGIPLCTL